MSGIHGYWYRIHTAHGCLCVAQRRVAHGAVQRTNTGHRDCRYNKVRNVLIMLHIIIKGLLSYGK